MSGRLLITASTLILAFSMSPLLAEPWPCFHRSVDRAGASAETLVPPMTLAWQFQADGEIVSSPAVYKGTVYFGSRDGKIYALDAFNGAKKWEFATGGRVDSSPAVDSGVVFVSSTSGNLFALNAQTGAVKWTYTTGGTDLSSPAVSEGKVYTGTGYPNCDIYAVNQETGSLVWKYTTNQMVYASPSVSGSRVICGSDDADFRCFDKNTGSVIWSFPTSGGIFMTSVAICGDTMYFAPGDWDRKIYAVDLATGTHIRWTFTVPQTYYQINSYVSTPAVGGGAVYFVGGVPTQSIFALNAQTGAKLWDHPLGATSSAAFASSPAIVGDVIYLGASAGYVCALDKYTGNELWRYNLGAPVVSSVAISDDWLYVGDDSGKLNAFTRTAEAAAGLKIFRSPTNFVKVGWNLVSAPAIPADATPATVFGAIDIVNASFQFWLNSCNGGYQRHGAVWGWTGPIQVGVPYWFMETKKTKTLSFTGYQVVDDWRIDIPAQSRSPYWIMFGHPFDHATPCDAIRFSNTSHPTPLSWSDAYDAGIVESNAQGYDAGTSGFVSTTPTRWFGAKHTLDPWYGYWILMNQAEATSIHFPVGALR